jgi:hypothetical protein
MEHTIQRLEREVVQKRAKFTVLSRRLAQQLNQAAEELERDGRAPNELGVVQGNGARLDIIAAEYAMAKHHLEMVKAAQGLEG